jgi:hypothetical protein
MGIPGGNVRQLMKGELIKRLEFEVEAKAEFIRRLDERGKAKFQAITMDVEL